MSHPDPVAHYDAHAQSYFDTVVGIDTRDHLRVLLDRLPAGSLVIDAGCGSGRDTRWMREAGFEVYPFDAAPALAKLAQVHTGSVVHVHRFNDLEGKGQAQGLLAMASLLFLDDAALTHTLGVLGRALAPGGFLLAAFKEGVGTHVEGNRVYFDKQLSDLPWLARAAGAKPVRAWLECETSGRLQTWACFLMQRAG